MCFGEMAKFAWVFEEEWWLIEQSLTQGEDFGAELLPRQSSLDASHLTNALVKASLL